MNASVATIADNIARVRERISDAAARADRAADSVTLVAVTKTMPTEAIVAAHAAGQRHFGENRVQEGEAKIEAVALDGITWHLIGHLQTNKARPAARLFSIVESVDSRRVAEALSREAEKAGRVLDVLLEVNYAGEATKFGFSPDEVRAEAPAIGSLPALRVIGLMTIAPHVQNPEEVRPVFRGLRALGDQVRASLGDTPIWHLSMGMSNDFAVAIEEGATIVRVGRAIFGERPTR